jgi:PKD repeat protein
MAPDGTIYALAGGYWPNDPALLKSVPNQPPRIDSLKQWVTGTVGEDKVGVRLEGRIVDPLGRNRQHPLLSVDWGDGETDIDELFFLREEEGHYQRGFIFAHTYPAGETYTPKVKVAAEGCEEFYTEKTITVCLEPPTIESVSATPRHAYAGTTSVDFECTATPPQAQSGSPLVYTWDFGDGVTQSGSEVSHRYTEPGTYQAKVTVNVAGSPVPASYTVTVVVEELPELAVTVSPAEDQPEAGVKFDFQCTVEDPFGQSPSSFTWSFGDGETSSERAPSHLYTDPGTYEASVEVQLPGSDENPSASLTKEFQVCAQPPEIRALTYFPEPAHVGVPVKFSCTAQGYCGEILLYTWDFGDGTTQTGSEVSHRYIKPGTYQAKVTVNVSGSPVQASETVIVKTVKVEEPVKIVKVGDEEAVSCGDILYHPSLYSDVASIGNALQGLVERKFEIISPITGHVGIVACDGTVIEAVGSGVRRLDSVAEFIHHYRDSMITMVYALRVTGVSDLVRKEAVEFAAKQIGKEYDWASIITGCKQIFGDKYYCSELVWAAYEVASGAKEGVFVDDCGTVDLDWSDGTNKWVNAIDFVYPVEIYLSSMTEVIKTWDARTYEGE